MSADEIGGVLRTILASLGGIVAAKGWMDAATYQIVAGTAVTVVTAVWSIIQKRNAAKTVEAAAATGVVPK